MKRNHTVSLCMIVKDEERYLRRCLSSVQDMIDEMIIIDTGSKDATIDIAKEFGAIIETIEWHQDFSEARNRSLSLATKDWILVLDADEYLRQEDRDKLIEALNDFSNEGYIIKTLNYNTEDNNSFITNLNQRIFKNNHNYHYTGAIHEQVTCIDSSKQNGTFKIIDVGFYHMGYVPSVVKSKNKMYRNLDILKKVAVEDPTNDFTLFNLANEYSQLGQEDEALRLYNEVYYKGDFTVGFMPKLMMFRLQCLMNQKKYDEALQAIAEGLQIYPDFTELMYFRGIIERQDGEVIKAIRSFEKCLEMGKPRAQLEFQELCYGLGPAFALAEIYEEQQDYQMAISYYNKCLSIDPSKYQVLYPVSRCLKELKLPPSIIAQKLSQYFILTETSNQVIYIDLLILATCYEEAHQFLQQCSEKDSHVQLIYLNAKIEFYLKHIDKAQKLFQKYANYVSFQQVEQYLFIIELLQSQKSETKWSSFYKTLKEVENEKTIVEFEDSEDAIQKLLLFLRELALIEERKYFDLFSKVAIAMYASSHALSLAKLFKEVGYSKLAYKVIIESILKTGDCKKEDAILLASVSPL